MISDGLILGLRTFLLGLVAVLLVPSLTAHRLAREFGFEVIGLVTLAVIVSVFQLVSSLGGGRYAPALLRDVALLWVINFAVWYLEIDDGCPARRHREGHVSESFMFPQMTCDDKAARSPSFLDYLFLAFNTSTAVSPTDTVFPSRQAKVLMMV